jgi:hypothetical protein
MHLFLTYLATFLFVSSSSSPCNLSCKAGQFLNESNLCEICPAGKYNDGRNSSISLCIDCPLGYSQHKPESSTCVPCSPGQYQNNVGQEKCLRCGINYFSEKAKATQCRKCWPGFSTEFRPKLNSSDPGMNWCVPCAAGRYGKGAWGEDCEACAEGRYRPSHKEHCQKELIQALDNVKAMKNMKNTLTTITSTLPMEHSCKSYIMTAEECVHYIQSKGCNLMNCKECPKGYYQNLKYGSSCKKCPQGYYQQQQNQLQCEICPQGFYGVSQDISPDFCSECQSGKYSDIEGRILEKHCMLCPAGWYNTKSASTKCIACQTGYYHQGEAGKTNWPCVECGKKWEKGTQIRVRKNGEYIGEYSNLSGVKQCFSCPAGYFTNQTRSRSCFTCPAGFYQQNMGKIKCEKCNRGYFTPNVGSRICKQCPMGKVIKVEGSSKCNHCPSGFFMNEPGKFECKTCQTGIMNESKFNSNNGASSLSDCYSGFRKCKENIEFLDDLPIEWNQRRCWPCKTKSRGTHCVGFLKLSDGNLTHKKDYWTVPWWDSSPENFQKCPFKHSCGTSTQGCIKNTSGVLCANCLPNHFRNKVGQCLKCNAGTVLERGGILVSIFLIIWVIFVTQRKRCRRLQRKYGDAWRDILRIITIQVNYAQINASLPMVIEISWPNVYLNFLDKLTFVNVDIVGILGIECIGDVEWDYRFGVAIVCALPLLIAIVAAVSYKFHVRNVHERTKSDLNVRAAAVEYMYDIVDSDQSEEIDVNEFEALMNRNLNDEKRQENSVEEIMKKLGAHEGEKLVLTKDQFIKSAASGRMSKVIGHQWISWAELTRLKSSYSSIILVILFLLHAPISQRLFSYFVCHDVGNCHDKGNEKECKRFLAADYRIECGVDKHLNFQPFVWIYLILFTFLFPITVGAQLFINRNRLQTVVIRHRLGFLYAPFNAGSEFWELHELTRKLLLTGVLIFIRETMPRIAVAILICCITVATLHYYKPHKNTTVFRVAQISFILSTFKYVATLLILHDEAMNQVGDNVSQKEQIGELLVILDVLFFLGSLAAGLFAIFLLRKSIITSAKKHEYQKKLLAEKRKSLAMVQPLSIGENQQQQQKPQEKIICDSMQQIYRKKVLNKMQNVINNSSQKLSSNGRVYVNKILTANKAHITQMRHAESKALIALKVNKKKLDSTRRLESRLLTRSRSKKKEKGEH